MKTHKTLQAQAISSLFIALALAYNDQNLPAGPSVYFCLHLWVLRGDKSVNDQCVRFLFLDVLRCLKEPSQFGLDCNRISVSFRLENNFCGC